MSKLKVNELDTESGTTITVAAGKTIAGTDIIDTAQIAAGAVGTTELDSSLDLSGKTLTLPATLPTTAGTNITSIPGGNIIGTIPSAALGNVDLTGLEADIALLAFKTQANGNLARYNLIDQSVDAFEDASGVNSGASTNATRDSTGKYYSGATPVTTSLTTVGSSSWSAPAAIVSPMNLLVVGGGGGSATQGNGNGAGGAGGLVYISAYTVVGGQAYTYTVGAGGANFTSSPSPANQPGNSGTNSVFDGAGYHQTITANGGGGGATNQVAGVVGGSGGGEANGPGSGTNPASNQPVSFGSYTNVGWGNAGGNNSSGSNMSGGGGGGAGGVGAGAPAAATGGAGGIGKDYSSVFGTGVGESGWFAGGGGGAGGPAPAAGAGGQGGGGDGGRYNQPADGGTPGTANTGGGGGGAAADKYPTGAGGSGVIILKYNTLGDMILVSNAVTAAQATDPTKADVVLTYTNNAGTAALNGDIICSVSRDGGTTYTATTLVGQGTTGSQTIATASDVVISGQPAGKSMVYKVATNNQSGSKKTYINGVSLGWS